jgi:cyclic pyranopterin phosphate synthase
MRRRNEDQILPLMHYAAQQKIALRFIELMPVSSAEWIAETNFLPVKEVRARLQQLDEMIPVDDSLGFGPARYYRLPKIGVTIGLIGAMSDLKFCERCNKMRLTCDGKLRPCLGNHLEIDLVPGLRPTFNPQKLQQLFRSVLAEKPEEHSFRNQFVSLRGMTAIGG